ncbi:MAG: WG repeat-containing protein, partial [Bacteroidota bacterium]
MEPIRISAILGLFLLVMPTGEQNLYAQSLPIPFQKEGKWGYETSDQKTLIKPIFDIANPFHQSLGQVCKNGKWGLVKPNGKWLYKCRFDQRVEPFFQGRARAKVGGKWGLILSSGKKLLPFRYEGILAPYTRDTIWARKESKWGLIDLFGNTLVDFQFDTIRRTPNVSIWEVVKDGRRGWVDSEGNVAFSSQPFLQPEVKAKDNILAIRTHLEEGRRCWNNRLIKEERVWEIAAAEGLLEALSPFEDPEIRMVAWQGN